MAELEKFEMVIGGQWVGAVSGKTFESYNPYTAQPWAEIPKGGVADVDGECKRVFRNVTERFEMIVVVRSERGLGEENFVQNNPQGPPVDAVIMPHLFQMLSTNLCVLLTLPSRWARGKLQHR